MSMKRLAALTVLSMMVLGLSAAIVCAAEGQVQTKTGTVKKVDVGGKQIVVMVARELTFTVTDATQIVQGDAPKKLADIKVDNQVSVEYVKEGETRTAKKIAILADK